MTEHSTPGEESHRAPDLAVEVFVLEREP